MRHLVEEEEVSDEETVVLHVAQEGGSPAGSAAAREDLGERELDRCLTEQVIDPLDFQCPVEQAFDFPDFPEPVPVPYDSLERELEQEWVELGLRRRVCSQGFHESRVTGDSGGLSPVLRHVVRALTPPTLRILR
ncbi:hypothetical protein Q8A67_023362 [Cirrhinus molitorella]|uniref:Uncharacterized protein n=1 Tax=Cirrhinus molitorella TaxID=172907 RepID=A0AA88NZS8_9TELE|nr:hypothetical protein Q8A67_023362 [Cirrhinus molitorella]